MEIEREEIKIHLRPYTVQMYNEVTIKEARKYLDTIEKEGVERFAFSDAGSDCVIIEAYITRPETDEEYNKRVDTRKQTIARKDKRDRALFEELKARFETKSNL